MAAAVGDYRPISPSDHKIRRCTAGQPVHLELRPNEDIIAQIGQARRGHRPLLVGFSLSTPDHDLVQEARGKLGRKGLDLIVANRADEAFGGETNRASFVSSSAADRYPSETKIELAERIVRWLVDKLGDPD
jgi:phosphopantothenoylcysteine decarboxylase/phosphopantothenate--cysteine ligase